MSDAGMPPRRSGAARAVLFTLAGLAILGGGGWLAYRQHLLAGLLPGADTPPVTRIALVRSETASSAPASGVAAGPADVTAGAATKPAGGSPGAAAEAHDPAGPARTDTQSSTSGRDDAGAAPRFDVVRVAPGGSAVIAGRAAPHADVRLLDNGAEIGRATADDDGQFVVIPDRDLPAGGQELALEELGTDGRAVRGEAPALVVVPQRAGKDDSAAPARQGATSAADPSGDHAGPVEGRGAVAVLAPSDAAPRLLSVPSDEPRKNGRVALRVVDYDAKGDIRFAGTARPGSVVRLYVDNRQVGEAQADAEGRWALAPEGGVDPGGHTLRADALGAGGKVMSRAELPFQRAAFAADAPSGGRIVVQPRQSLWRIARHVYGHGMRYTLIFAANRDQIRDPSRIYPGQVFTLPAGVEAPPAR